MPIAPVYNMAGEKVGQIQLSDSVFGIEPNVAVMHEVVKQYLAAQRQGTQSTLTRAEVSGGGRKPWRQKGTGRARQGSIRAPQWTHGGIALGPKPRSYTYRVNKKIKRLALRSALSSKMAADRIIILDQLKLDQIKTKSIVSMLKALNVGGRALIVTKEADEKVVKSARNIPGVSTTIVGSLNTYDVLNGGSIILVQDAANLIQEVYCQ